MRAMILAAGRGERMRPLTDKTPKPLLKINGRHLIEYHIASLRLAGISELVINTGWLGEQLPATLGDGRQYGVSIEYSAEPPTAYETGGGIFHALDKLSDPFIVVNGDIWTDYDYSRLAIKGGILAHLVFVDNPPQHPAGDFAIDDGYARVDGSEKLTFSGIGCYRKALFEGQQAGSFPLAPILRQHMQDNAVTAEHYRGVWNDIGTPERLKALDASAGNPPDR